jgi:hypothetical protein
MKKIFGLLAVAAVLAAAVVAVTPPTPAVAGAGNTVYITGDIFSVDAHSHADAIAAAIENDSELKAASRIIPAGDLVYDFDTNGQDITVDYGDADVASETNVYDQYWGAENTIGSSNAFAMSRPVIGNHEYDDSEDTVITAASDTAAWNGAVDGAADEFRSYWCSDKAGQGSYSSSSTDAWDKCVDGRSPGKLHWDDGTVDDLGVTEPGEVNYGFDTGIPVCDDTGTYNAAGSPPDYGCTGTSIGTLAYHSPARFVLINTECDNGPGSGAAVTCTAVTDFVEAELAASAAEGTQCQVIVSHRPAISSDTSQDWNGHSQMDPIWAAAYDGHAEAFVSGHQHTLERFGKLDDTYSSPGANFGVKQFVVGGGGREGGRTIGTDETPVFSSTSYGYLRVQAQPAGTSLLFNFFDESNTLLDPLTGSNATSCTL